MDPLARLAITGLAALLGALPAAAQEYGLPTQVTHHKIIGRAGWGQSTETLRLVAEARERGVDVTLDQYPCTASSTSFAAALFPSWALEGNAEARAARLGDPETRGRIRAAVVDKILNERGGGDASRLQVAACPHDLSLDGKTLDTILRDRGLVRPGMKVDLVAFDPATIRDRATFGEPHAYAEGVSHVVVNGFVVVDEGRPTGVRPGRVLLGPGVVEEGGPRP